MASINLGRVQGYSAYEIAVQNGYSGTEQEWLASLKGTNGTNGTNGTDGVSPVASVERNQADTGAVITITDATGTTTATVYDGSTPSLTGYATETYVDNAVGAIDVPTATSDLTNDSGFITSADLSGYATTSALTTGLATKQDTLTAGDNITISNNVISATGGLPPISQGDSGKVLTVNRNEDGAEWVSPEAELPVIGASDEGKVLTVGVSGVEWDTPSTPSIATTQTVGLVKPDGSTITIDANGTISSAGGSSNAITYDTYNNIVQPSDTANTIPSAATVKDNVILGSNNQITGMGATSNNVIGGNSNNVIRSENNFVIGQSNTVQAGYDSNYTLRIARHNIVAGQNNTLTRASASIIGGDTNTVSSSNAVVVGSGLTGTGLNQAIFGKYNSDSASPFVIGIGTNSSAKADGFKVTSAGNGVFAGTVQATDFLDSNGNSIVGGGRDSLPTINSGDAGKALVVNSGETGVEWATVGGGSAPVDPEASSKNVYTGDGYWNNAYTVWEDASINSLTITPSTPVTQSSNIFTLTTTTDFAEWGTQPLHMRLVGETIGSEHAEWEGDMLIWGSSGGLYTYRDAEEYWELTRTESSGTYTYTLKRIMYEQSSSIDTLSSFFISGDKFKTKLNDYGVQTRSIDINPGSDYIQVSGDYGSDYSNYTITPVLYPDKRETRVTDTTIMTINATGTVIGDSTMWQVQNVDFTDQQWTDWLASSGRAMRLRDDGGNEIWLQIDIDDSETSSPYSGQNGETITVDRYLEISVPDTSWDGKVLDSVELSHLTTEDYGLITYNNLPDVTLNHITLKDRTTGDVYAIYVDNGKIGIEAVNSGM